MLAGGAAPAIAGGAARRPVHPTMSTSATIAEHLAALSPIDDVRATADYRRRGGGGAGAPRAPELRGRRDERGHVRRERIVGAGGPVGAASERRPARRPGAHRDQGGMRRRRLRRVHGPARRRAGERVHDAGRAPRRSAGADARGTDASGECRGCSVVPDARRRAVRDLHARHAGVGGGAPAGHAGAHRAAGDGRARRRALPLHGLPQDHRGRDERAARPRSPSRRPRSARPSGHRVRRVDGQRKVDGTDVFGADESPDGALVDPGGALAVPSGPLPARRPGRVRRRAPGRRRGVHRGRHPRPQPVRRDPGDRRSARVRGATRRCASGARRSR